MASFKPSCVIWGLSWMAFITASDEIDTMEYVLFPKVYSEYTNLSKNDIIKVNGKVERRNKYQIIVNSIEKCI